VSFLHVETCRIMVVRNRRTEKRKINLYKHYVY
jgi:hypothetical protein